LSPDPSVVDLKFLPFLPHPRNFKSKATLVCTRALILHQTNRHSQTLYRGDDLTVTVKIAVHVRRCNEEIRGFPNARPMQMRWRLLLE